MAQDIRFFVPRNEEILEEIIAWLDLRALEPGVSRIDRSDIVFEGHFFDYSIERQVVHHTLTEMTLAYAITVDEDQVQTEFALAFNDHIILKLA